MLIRLKLLSNTYFSLAQVRRSILTVCGRYRKTIPRPRVESKTPNAALRAFHRQTLGKAIDSLETQGPNEKVIGSETFAIDCDLLPEFRALADHFFNEALALAQKSKNKNQVYHLGVQFFRLTQSQGEKQ